MNQRIFQKDKLVTKMLGLTSSLCFVLLVCRIYFSSSFYYGFLLWNLFLAWIPLLLSHAIVKQNFLSNPKIIIYLLFAAWLLFFPNAPYILTDLFHLRKTQNIPLWYDLVLIISFAWNGLMLGFVSLLEIQKFLNEKYAPQISWLIVIVVLVLSGFGIYLGRYERWNSWDILTNPVSLSLNIIDSVVNPFAHPKTIGVTVLFSAFLIINYLTLFILVKSKSYEQ